MDRDLAMLYGVPTKALKQAVKRNAERFPDDFMFELNKNEFQQWKSHFVTSKADKMGLRYALLRSLNSASQCFRAFLEARVQ